MDKEKEVVEAFGLEHEEKSTESSNQNDEKNIDKEKVETSQEPQLSQIEIEAQEMGHVSKEKWEESGKDPEEWITAREFVRYGKLQNAMHKKLEAQSAQFESRLDNLNKYHEAQLALQLNSLKAQQRQAASDGDIETFDKLQNEMEELSKTPSPADPSLSKPAEVIAWEKENPWILNASDNRSIVANAKYNQFFAQNPNGTQAEALAYIDAQLLEAFPKLNPRRAAAAPSSETSHRQSKNTKQVTMNDLTYEERQLWDVAGNDLYGGNQETFLAAVKDARG